MFMLGLIFVSPNQNERRKSDRIMNELCIQKMKEIKGTSGLCRGALSRAVSFEKVSIDGLHLGFFPSFILGILFPSRMLSLGGKKLCPFVKEFVTK